MLSERSTPFRPHISKRFPLFPVILDCEHPIFAILVTRCRTSRHCVNIYTFKVEPFTRRKHFQDRNIFQSFPLYSVILNSRHPIFAFLVAYCTIWHFQDRNIFQSTLRGWNPYNMHSKGWSAPRPHVYKGVLLYSVILNSRDPIFAFLVAHCTMWHH